MTQENRPGTALQVSELRVMTAAGQLLVGPLSFSVLPGECVALLGDSGSGKTLTLRALLNLLPEGISWTAAEFHIDGRDALQFSERDWQRQRGRAIALVQQDAGEGLDPLKRVQSEVLEAARVHDRRAEPSGRGDQAGALLMRAGLVNAQSLLTKWPHELSGGMRQRAVLASALSGDPQLLLADEPTTSLDATVQQAVLASLRELKARGLAMLLVSHDPFVVQQIAERTIRLTPANEPEVLVAPRLSSRIVPATRPNASAAPLLEVRGLHARYSDTRSRSVSNQAEPFALSDVSFSLAAGHILGIVGESGAGKTTLARILTASMTPTSGEVIIDGLPWSHLRERSRRSERWRVQWVPQDPLASFARGMSVADILREALSVAPARPTDVDARIAELLQSVGLDETMGKRQPKTLSGGQRQRVAIARALATSPQVLICDEAVSALDASAREGIEELLRNLAENQLCSVVFISHDIGVVARVSDELIVMREGRIVERGETESVLNSPEHPFTQSLIADSGYSR